MSVESLKKCQGEASDPFQLNASTVHISFRTIKTVEFLEKNLPEYRITV